MFAKVKDNICLMYPYTDFELKQDNPFTLYAAPIDLPAIFPLTEQATIHGCELVEVALGEKPAYDDHTQRLLENQPIKEGETWVVTYTIEELTAEEQQNLYDGRANSVRQKRNRMLSESDWTQIADSTADKPAWAAYRQELRDVTAQAGFPWEVTWPVAP
jgi:hypothetical protein